MRLSLITVKRRPDSDEISRRETLVEGDALRVGRGADVEVHLPDVDVAYHHATLSQIDGGVLLEATAGSVIMVDGKPVDRVELKRGVSARIGRFELTGEDAPDHADRAVALSRSEAEEAPPERPQTIAETLPSRRRLSWLLIAAVLAVFVAWPLAEIYDRPAPAPGEVIVAGMTPPSQSDEGQPFTPMEASWISGPMSVAHASLEQDCSACHQRPFEMTTNDSCLACHADVAQHAAVADHPMMALENFRCAACHKEHVGGDAPIEAALALCTDCHADLKGFSPETKLLDVTDFGVNHPQFRATIVTGTEYAEGRLLPVTQRVSLDEIDPLKEVSGLKFPHNVHLNKDGVRGLGRASDQKWEMTCQSCHVAEADGALMRPIEMERDCGYCHELTFQPENIDFLRELPHAKAQEVSEIVHDYYQARVLEGGLETPDAPAGARRRPGELMSAAERAVTLAWASEQAERELTGIMETRLCGDCHVARRDEETDDRGRAVWRVEGALLQRHWMPKSSFDHGPHFAMDCVSCHAATESKDATDVLMPKIGLCQECHKGAAAGEATASSNCLACHDYHIDRYGPMSVPHGEAFAARRLEAERVEVKRTE